MTPQEIQWVNEDTMTRYDASCRRCSRLKKTHVADRTHNATVTQRSAPNAPWPHQTSTKHVGYHNPVRGFTPRIGEGTFVAPNASIIGDVVIGRDCSIWFNTVIRGDVNSIRIADRVNIQDGTVLHTLYQKSTIEIGEDVSIGHNVTLHGCHIRPFALIGMGPW